PGRGIPAPTPTRWKTRVGGPGWLRYSGAQIWPIFSRLASRAPRPGSYATIHAVGTLGDEIAVRPQLLSRRAQSRSRPRDCGVDDRARRVSQAGGGTVSRSTRCVRARGEGTRRGRAHRASERAAAARPGLPYSEDLIIDAFNGGALLSRDACRQRLQQFMETGDAEEESEPLVEAQLFVHATKPQILARMLLNLKQTYVKMHSFPQARDVTELLLAVNPSGINELRDRGLLAYHLKDFSGALRDLQTYLQLSARPAIDEQEREEQEQI